MLDGTIYFYKENQIILIMSSKPEVFFFQTMETKRNASEKEFLVQLAKCV